MTKGHFARHGDVILVPVDVVPSEFPLAKHNGACVLAWGEITSHSHQLRVKNPENLKVFQLGPKLYVQLLEVGTLTHEEHKTIEIQPGTYRRDMEREYDYAMESFRTVID